MGEVGTIGPACRLPSLLNWHRQGWEETKAGVLEAEEEEESRGGNCEHSVMGSRAQQSGWP